MLTQEELDALPPGTLITVVWSGGNGPFEYVVAKKWGRTYAAFIRRGVLHLVAELDFVGPERPHTMVWLKESREG